MIRKGRYEIGEVLGEGGMGVVYRAFDPVMNRDVTLKTIRDSQDKAVIDLFRRECAVLASMTHPNIVEIFDIGESNEDGAKHPFFVMPYLKGDTLQKLIDTSSTRLNVERSVYMISQACRGLQAAHDQGLIHRDLKPSNLFVLSDDSVKIIDFGVAHLTNHNSVTGVKGTVPYMAPEQLRMKPPTPLSDQFSIAVVCYEMLARRHPFKGVGEVDLVQAILKHTPVPVSEFNPLVSGQICQVIHKALAKDPFYRFANVREFADCLEKALRGEPIDKFDTSRVAPRLEKAKTAVERGDLEDASEIIAELESANYLAPEIQSLRKQIDELRQNKTIKQLLETAQRRFDEGEFVRALQKVQEVLSLDSHNTDAFTLKGAIETRASATQIDEWFRLAHQHMENYAYGHARQALEKVLEIRPNEARAKSLLAEIERQEQDYIRLRAEKQQSYDSAVKAYERGDLNSVINKMHHVFELDRRIPNSTSPEQAASFQELYEAARSKREQIASHETEARRLLNDGKFAEALSICDEVLGAYPTNVVFRALRDDVETAERQEISAYVANIEKEVGAEPDLNRKVSILEEAKRRYPTEQRFDQSLQLVRSRRDMVNSAVARARTLEEGRQFSDALEQWETLRNIYPKYPGLDVEIDRLKKRHQQQTREDAKARWIAQIDHAVTVRNYSKANSLMAEADAEFAGDGELAALRRQIEQAEGSAAEAEEKTRQGKELYNAGNAEEGISLLRQAGALNPDNPMVKAALLETLLKEARTRVEEDWHAAEPFVKEALELDSNNSEARSLETIMKDRRQAEEVSLSLSKARELQTAGQTKEAIDVMDQALKAHPRENRLIQFRTSLWASLPQKEREGLRGHALSEVQELAKESEETRDLKQLESIFLKSVAFDKFRSEEEFREPLRAIASRFRKEEPGEKPAAAHGLPAEQNPQEQADMGPQEPVSEISHAAAPGILESAQSQGLFRNLALGLVAFLVVAGVIWSLIVRNLDANTNPASPAAAKLTRIEVKNAAQGEYKITASNGSDVTAAAGSGLNPGNYTISASRAGYKPTEMQFSVDPRKEPQKAVEVLWIALPTQVRILLPRSGFGALQIDGKDLAPSNTGEIVTELTKGTHSVSWTAPGAFFDVEIDIDGTVGLKNPMPVGSFYGLAAVLNGKELTYQGINVSGFVKAAGKKVESISAAGTVALEGTDPTALKYNGVSLGEFAASPTGQPQAYLRLERVGSVVKPAPKAAGTPAAQPAAPPKPTDEDVQKEKLELKKKILDKI